ncbi:hypothetical protein SAMN05444422_105288 [Halobiforma haloterrestris]|uniref:Uncharacterized protein n=2 Tax=Natronobacterium haloterrestre TaxID=148448 RepID=A0A1I1HAU1_NATHA|nr:hypothetical protein SAMN05444422_105288 [Halobiforma haloterrestris]
MLMSEDEVRQQARKAGMTPREYCLREISEWKEMLHTVSDDYGGLDDDEFDELVEKEIDSFRAEQESED